MHLIVCAQVRLQTQSHTNPIYTGLVDCVRKTWKAEGAAGFYKVSQRCARGRTAGDVRCDALLETMRMRTDPRARCIVTCVRCACVRRE